jgi:hypothetical protein
MADQERDRLAGILEAGDIAASEEALFMLQEGITPTEAEAESRSDRLARSTGIGAGLHGIAYAYRALKIAEDQAARRDDDYVDEIAVKASALADVLTEHRAKLWWCDLDLDVEMLIEKLKMLANVAAEHSSFTVELYPPSKGRPPQPETHLFDDLLSLYAKLCGSAPGVDGRPAYRFIKAAAEFIDPIILVPPHDRLRARLRQHRKKTPAQAETI